ncbi:hypothetical protein U1Q18_040264 [Sarracenia purpurea var. burkii]
MHDLRREKIETEEGEEKTKTGAPSACSLAGYGERVMQEENKRPPLSTIVAPLARKPRHRCSHQLLSDDFGGRILGSCHRLRYGDRIYIVYADFGEREKREAALMKML